MSWVTLSYWLPVAYSNHHYFSRSTHLKQEFEYFPNPKNTIKFGVYSTYHTVVPGQIDVSDNSSITPPDLQERYSWENALFFSNNWTVSERLNMVYGLRLSSAC